MNRIMIASVVSLVAGLGAGWGLHPASPASAPDLVAQPTAEVVGAPVALAAPSTDLSAMRAIIREELAAAQGGKSVNVQPAPAATAVSAQTVVRSNEAMQAIDGMFASGAWDANQRRSFQQKVLLLDPDQRQHELQRLATGINSGAIRFRTDGRPPM